ncbi:MAG: hypothetical protein K8L99_16395 [Anaerolineae bacterium]|nr:hypothetical protein [Anaerolineae bacterium]
MAEVLQPFMSRGAALEVVFIRCVLRPYRAIRQGFNHNTCPVKSTTINRRVTG